MADTVDRKPLSRDYHLIRGANPFRDAFYLELRDGSRVNLPKRIEKAIYAEVTHLPRRCPRITSSME